MYVRELFKWIHLCLVLYWKYNCIFFFLRDIFLIQYFRYIFYISVYFTQKCHKNSWFSIDCSRSAKVFRWHICDHKCENFQMNRALVTYWMAIGHSHKLTRKIVPNRTLCSHIDRRWWCFFFVFIAVHMIYEKLFSH